jgi:regulator of RNase E activity RraA
MESKKMKLIKLVLLACTALALAAPATAQVRQTREQMMNYTADWKGDRFADGRPKVPDSLLERATHVPIEDIWGFLRNKGYNCQFDGGWQSLHPDRPFSGRALTAQYMPMRPDMFKAITAEGNRDNRVTGNNQWPINELQPGDVYVADGYGKVVEGTLIGSNLGSGIGAHLKGSGGFVFDAGIRDAEENREIEGLNGIYRAYDPSAWRDMTLTAINAPIRIGRATVLPGDVVLVKRDGAIFIPAILAEEAVASAEFTQLEDAYNFELNKSGSNGGEFEGGWTPKKYDAMASWALGTPGRVKMPRAEFNQMLAERKARNATVRSEAPKK